MKLFFRKYWTHILNIFYLLIGTTMFILIGLKRDTFFLPGMIVFMVLTLLLWFEIIWHIVAAARNKDDENKVLHAILCYILSIFYIPCYRLKYIIKDEKYKIKNIVYLVTSIGLYLLMFVVIFVSSFIYGYKNASKHNNSISNSKYENIYYVTKYIDNGKVSIALPNTYIEDLSYGYDYSAYDSNSFVGVYVYDEEYNTTSDEVLNYQENYIKENRENVKSKDNFNYKLDSKNITYEVLEATYEDDEKIYILSTTTFDDKPNYVLYIHQITFKENYEKQKNEMKKILESARLTS